MNNPNSTRRRFLKQTSAAAAALSVAPYILADDKTGTRPPIVGVGEHQYEALHDWGELPAGHVYGNTHGVAVDAQGHIHIKHTVGNGAKIEDAVVVFDADGKFIRSWGKAYKGGAHGLHLSREGGEEFFYLCDPKRHLFAKTTLDGKELWRKWAPEQCNGYTMPGEFNPTNIAIAPNGDILWRTATAKVSSTNTTATLNTSAASVARARSLGRPIARMG